MPQIPGPLHSTFVRATNNVDELEQHELERLIEAGKIVNEVFDSVVARTQRRMRESRAVGQG